MQTFFSVAALAALLVGIAILNPMGEKKPSLLWEKIGWVSIILFPLFGFLGKCLFP